MMVYSKGTAVCFLPLAIALVLPSHAQEAKRGRKYKDPPPVSHIDVSVIRASNGKPVENAAVIFHTFHEGKDLGNMEIKTDEEGRAVLELIPMGDEVQVQVVKSGYQTYGETFTNDQTRRTLEVKIKPPTGQYSSYQKAPVDTNGAQSVTPQPTQSSSKPATGPH